MQLSSLLILAPAFLIAYTNAQGTAGMGLTEATQSTPSLASVANALLAAPAVVARAEQMGASGTAVNMFAPTNTAGSRLFRRQSEYDISYQITHAPTVVLKRNYYKEEKVTYPVGVEESFLDNPAFFNIAQNKSTGQRVVTSAIPSKSPYKRGYEPPQVLQISSGLGTTVTTVGTPIKWKYGWIFPVTAFFTLPETVTDTLKQTGLITFWKAIKKEGVGHKIDKTPSVTTFAPLNPLDCASVLDVILFGSVIYSPDFVVGTFKAASGATLNITQSGGSFYVNDSKIVRTDVITENGVAHYFDNKPTK